MFMPDNSVFVPVENPNMTGERTQNAVLPMEERLTSFQEIQKTYTPEEAARRGKPLPGLSQKVVLRPLSRRHARAGLH